VRFVCVVAVCLLACGDNAVPTIDQYRAAYGGALCRYRVRCGLLPSTDACAPFYSAELHPDALAAVAAGILVFDPDVAWACIDWVDHLSCDPTDTAHREPGCFGVFTGTLHEGESCAWGSECISRECWTESTQCTEACCRGVCTGDTPPPVGGIGERCRYSACREGYCEDSLCVPLLPEGAACVLTAQCDVGLSCDPDRCTRLPGAGEPCTTSCRDFGQVCDGGRCKPIGLPGAPCSDDSTCSPFYTCEGTCMARQLGDDCIGSVVCPLPLVCDWRMGQCVEPKPDSEPCIYSYECESRSCGALRTCTSDSCY
jgi:hypothetical protein